MPHLCTGRHARDGSRLPRAPPAGERRQLVLRRPHRRRGRAGGGAGRRPGYGCRGAPAGRRRVRADRPAQRTVRPERANARGLDLSNEHALAALADAFAASATVPWRAAPTGVADGRGEVAAALFGGVAEGLRSFSEVLTGRSGAIVPVHVADASGAYPLEWLVRERMVTTNTAAAGDNASLMMID